MSSGQASSGNQFSSTEPFDFDQWKDLAALDPEQFEVERSRIINEVIERAPVDRQRRLRGMQWRIDSERRLTNNAMVSCINIYQQMWNRVYEKEGLLDQLNRTCPFPSDRGSN